jgi:metallo-beta-lactamase family protein
MAIAITFLGAAGTVTGAKYLVTAGRHRVLVDCGLFQGEKAWRLRNWEPLPVAPGSLSAVVLTHAHLDHSGYLPLLVRNGFRGRVFCSEATADLARILLLDSGHLQEEEAAFANRHGYSKHRPALPLYTRDDAQRCLGQFAPVRFGTSVEVAPGYVARLDPGGHILGASVVTLEAGGTRLVASGDLGRPHDPITVAPTAIAAADFVIVESTYGGRRHPTDPVAATLAAVIGRTVARGGKVIVPAFAVGRAQALLHLVAELKATGAIPSLLPVYLDSPMAAEVTGVYRRHRAEVRLSAAAMAAMCDAAHIAATPDESRALDEQAMPMVIIAASGMATGGRVLHHLRALGGDPRNTILFTGYQAVGTRGASIVAGAREVKMLGQWVTIRAEVAQLDGLSAHADSAEIIDWLRGFTQAPRTTFVTHGEPAAALALCADIAATLHWKTEVPQYGETFALADRALRVEG